MIKEVTMRFLSYTDITESLCDLLSGSYRITSYQIQVRKDMAFVNEYATDEDIEKYDLNGIWDKYHPARKGKYYVGQRPGFTIDRERNIFFIRVRQGRFDESNRTTALLWINGRHIIVELDIVGGLNLKGIKSDPYRMKWELTGYHPQLGGSESKGQIMSILNEALIAYGYSGVRKQLPNTIVEFSY
jgi:hypothetical protein